MTPTFFISDLHLCPSRPQTCDRFFRFLFDECRSAATLYILGDLFDYWVGDDNDDNFNATVCANLRQAVERDTTIYFIAGNRDFLVGERFSQATGVVLLKEPALIEIGGAPTLLMHGDTLCTDDSDYQQFRCQVRSAAWRQSFLAQPLGQRKAQVERMRQRSELEKSKKPLPLMDVNGDTVAEYFRQYGWPPRLIHGHTHRPAQHFLVVDGRPCERLVLAAWDDTPSYLAIDDAGCRTMTFS